MDLYYTQLRKLLFLLPPEVAHTVALTGLKYAYLLKKSITSDKSSPVMLNPSQIMGLTFPSPIGLAAGLDKNADYLEPLAALGFGFIEIGTVTPRPQKGNPKPRLFRLIEQEALINRMGFNNKGLDYVVNRLKKTKYNGILGINIGKNSSTPIDKAIDDYIIGFRCVAPYASYVTINISSPNTPQLRTLQQGELLQQLLRALKHEQTLQSKYVPLVVKISPDLSHADLENMATIFLEEKIDGIIATNTTTQRNVSTADKHANETGGLSGKPLGVQSTAVIKILNQFLQKKIPIIGCGGISSVNDAQDKVAAGASLLQLYTGLIYQGPSLVTDLIDNTITQPSPTSLNS